jgi:hypothetical protein
LHKNELKKLRPHLQHISCHPDQKDGNFRFNELLRNFKMI